MLLGNNHDNNNNNEVFERPFLIEPSPKARKTNNQRKRHKVPDTKNSHAAYTNVSLTSLSLHLDTHTHTHTHACMQAHTPHEHTYTHTHIYFPDYSKHV